MGSILPVTDTFCSVLHPHELHHHLVGVGGAVDSVGGDTGNAGHDLTELIGCEHVEGLGALRDGECAAVGHLHLVGSLLGGDHDHTVGCAATVDGCRGSILEDGEARYPRG